MALIEKLEAIGDAIRAKNGETEKYTLDGMVTAIGAIETGGGGDLPEEAFALTGDCTYRFAYNGWNWFVENYGKKINCNITNATNMFRNSNELTEIPFKITHNRNATTSIQISYMFSTCNKLMTLPEMGYFRPSAMDNLFQSCYRIREIPQSWIDNIDTSYMENLTTPYGGSQCNMFQSCYSLRKVPLRLLKGGNPNIGYSSTYFYCGFQYCHSLDELVGLPFTMTGNMSSNMFNSTFSNCSRLKNIIFETNEDGTPKIMNWKSQTIDLSSNVGYVNSASNITSYNSGITAADKAPTTDYATFQAFIDANPDNWWTDNSSYSRYTHDSAVNTINSLPDTSAYLVSAGGTNTIKFKGQSGAGRGLAINKLTAEEIAIATAKGWTVTFA